ncbi:MAG: hypothetical protein V3V41_04315 [Candidatus Heimdallarchaeota archaeon]
MFWKKSKTETRLEAIEQQIESTASRVSELSKNIEERLVDTRSQSKKEFTSSSDDLRSSLETLSLELNNQMLELSQRVEQLGTNSSAVNEQVEEFRKNYADVLEDLRQSTAIALEKEQIMARKYEELVDQLKEKEKLGIEKESLSQQHISTLQTEQEKKIAEVDKLTQKVNELENIIKNRDEKVETLTRRKEEAIELEHRVIQLTVEVEMQKYELERSTTKVQTMKDDTQQTLSSNKIIKSFLSESESGRILNHLLGLEQVSIDELATMTGIATFTVQQVVTHFKDIGLVTFDEGTRRVRLAEKS